MSKYSYINILKSEAKNLAIESTISRTEALELIAQRSSFSSYHELVTVSKQSPREVRLMKAALGTDDFSEVVFQDDVLQIINDVVEESLSGEIADTNAADFMIENLEVHDADFDNSVGVLFVELLFDYAGEQDPGRVYHGATFHVNATLQLARRGGKWNLSEPYGLELHDVERDVDRAYRLEEAGRKLFTHQESEA